MPATAAADPATQAILDAAVVEFERQACGGSRSTMWHAAPGEPDHDLPPIRQP
ncbi:hypothetical protein I553_3887 [Mycobacterium xenopi 4042]|uniref:Uncharacterized protein n=1 Tax=Mycobacterium xenopi 4042 TaxID=1299334 RepID=X8DEF5_MYCXE|nr:hypothetical protein I553_3887 [Mycobacterium xenopi 4042]